MNGTRYKRDRLVLDQTHVLQPGPFVPGTIKRLSFATPYSGPLAEPNTWLISFLIAAAFHASFLFVDKYLLVTPPDYGIQSTAASIEVYMVAAVPEPIQEAPVVQEKIPELIEAPSEMTVAKVEKNAEVKTPKEAQPEKIEIQKPQAKSEVKEGDGSAKNPGESRTTLSAQASSETFGKEGKYQNPPPQYPSLAERNGWEGTVMLKVFVEREGRASQVLIDRSSGFKVLDKAALKTVQKWQFEPGRLSSAVVASWIKIPIRFRIEKNL